jgi:hypothetical protein
MKAIIIGLLFLGLTSLCHAQVLEGKTLSEVEVYAVNSDYLNSVNYNAMPIEVSSLELEVANFNVHESTPIIIGKEKDYRDEDGNYPVKFSNNYGNIKAVYNEEGVVIQTTERFKNTKIPKAVLKSILKKYPDCVITKDLYLVTYINHEGTTIKYVIFLKSNNKRFKINLDEKGNIS